MAGASDERARTPVSAGYARALLKHYARSDEERAALLAGFGLDATLVDRPGAEMTVETLIATLTAITSRYGEDWPLTATTVWSNPLQGALDVATRTAPTIAAALAVAADHGPTFAPFIRARLRASGRTTRIEIEPALHMEKAAWRTIALAVALNVQVRFGEVLEDGLEQATMEFPWGAPSYEERLRARFVCRVKFGARAFAFDVPRALCERPSPFADPALHEKAIASLEEARQRVFGAPSIVETVRRMAEAALPHRLSEAEAARSLHCSRRTLQRRFAGASAGYRETLDGVLRDRARKMLEARSLSRDDMAAALGYTDSTSFSRACRRWFGSPPP